MIVSLYFSPAHAVDPPSAGGRALGLLGDAGVLHRGPPQFFELLDSRGRTDDPRVAEIPRGEHHRRASVQDAHASHDQQHSAERLRGVQVRRQESTRRDGWHDQALQ